MISDEDLKRWSNANELYVNRMSIEIARELLQRRERERWIPITEREPRENEIVWIELPNHRVCRGLWEWNSDDRKLFTQWRVETDDGDLVSIGEPLNWMPYIVPAPPEDVL